MKPKYTEAIAPKPFLYGNMPFIIILIFGASYINTY